MLGPKENVLGLHCRSVVISGQTINNLEPRFQGEGVVSGEYFLVSTKLDRFCYTTVQTAPVSYTHLTLPTILRV